MRKSTLPVSLAVALAASALSVVTASGALAATTVSPAEAGQPPVVRDHAVTVSVDRTAMTYYRSGASAAFAPQGAAAVAVGLTACRGDVVGGTNNSPRTTLTITAPDGSTVVSTTSAARDITLGSFLTSPTNQPVPNATPTASTHRGDFPDANAFHGLTASVDLKGKPAGTYTVTTRHTNKVKTGLLGGCTTGTPVSNGAGGFTNAAPTAGDQVETQTFEYRPWQVEFVDVLGAGKVSANVSPGELTFSIGGKKAAVFAAGPGVDQSFFAMPSGAVPLPADPAACATDFAGCLPPTAVECDPATACTPRIMGINKQATDADPSSLLGVFDLETKAFVALAKVQGTQRLLMSVGTANDAIYHDLLEQLKTAAAAQGIDLASVLATKVTIGAGEQQTSLSLLNGLQIDPATTAGGVQISTGATAQAGVVLNLYSTLRLTGGACVANSAGSTNGSRSYTHGEPSGYTVSTSDLLPAAPEVGPLAALTGGPVWLVKGTFAKDALLNASTAVIGVDSADGEANGLPVWVQPFVSGINTTKASTMEFLGTGTWTASETPVGQGCLSVNVLIGTGVAVYDNPLPVGLSTVLQPLSAPNPAAQELLAGVTDAVEQTTSAVTTDPAVASLLDQLVGGLPLTGVPLG